jgi:hypothetical protein
MTRGESMSEQAAAHEPGTVDTSGNWYVQKDDPWLILDELGPIASVSRWRRAKVGRLVAAAPALLAALERIRRIDKETPAMGRAAKAQEIAREAIRACDVATEVKEQG